ncbi:MAG: hypothetical protein HF970_01175 [ANME-2 cluster archaeon]|nr:hypothetical protein [ANME-2 cluster archaeon]
MILIRMLGEVCYSEKLGVLLVLAGDGSVKLYTAGTFQVTVEDRVTTEQLFEAAAR